MGLTYMYLQFFLDASIQLRARYFIEMAIFRLPVEFYLFLRKILLLLRRHVVKEWPFL